MNEKEAQELIRKINDLLLGMDPLEAIGALESAKHLLINQMITTSLIEEVKEEQEEEVKN